MHSTFGTCRISARHAVWQMCLVPGAVLLATPAFAHVGADAHFGLSEGFLHPFTGLDHLLAMLLVGVWAGQLGGRALWALPVSFLAVMAAGAVLGHAAGALSLVEAGIAFSTVLLGLAVALRLSVPAIAGSLICASFALLHGYAHGAELPDGARGIAFGLGFVVATALLHAAGIAIGARGARRTPALARASGAAAILAGLVLAVGPVGLA